MGTLVEQWAGLGSCVNPGPCSYGAEMLSAPGVSPDGEYDYPALTTLAELAEGPGRPGVIEMIAGADAVQQRFTEVHHAARHEIRRIVEAGERIGPSADAATASPIVAPGVRRRVIADRQWLQTPGARPAVAGALPGADELRIIDRVPIQMVVADRELGLLPLVAGQPVGLAGMAVHRSSILDAMIALFDELWLRGRPLAEADADRSARPLDARSRLDELDKQTLRLLLAGLTDNAIASHLEMSPRTVQRRIRQLMDLAGVTTRVQLGWQAARQEWL